MASKQCLKENIDYTIFRVQAEINFVAHKLIKVYHAKSMLKMKANMRCSQSLLCFPKKLTNNGVKYRTQNIQRIPQMSVTKLKVM
jgi:hypothetical protein